MESPVMSTTKLLDSLTEALTAATTAFPSDAQSLLPPKEGISLLDVKSDLLLSYLQNLVFLILLRLRSCNEDAKSSEYDEDVIKKLIELRVYMERGVRPLEGKLRYQIDKVLRAAEDAERLSTKQKTPTKTKKKKQINGNHNSSEESNNESETGEDDGDNESVNDEEVQEANVRPNAASLMAKIKSDNLKPTSAARASDNKGIYKPPRITPTAMPLPPSARERGDDGPTRRRKSNLLDEYIDEEISTAPRAQPSIGSNNTILDRGRSGLSARDREKERERTEYEERNFTRLPTESKAERRKARARGERDRRDMFGGEDWTGLGGLGDRINKSVSGKGGSSVLQRREKRGRDIGDGPRGDGVAIGDTFEKRRKIVDDRNSRKKGRR